MLRRYAVTCSAVAVVALVIALVAAHRQHTTYRSGCVVRFSIPLTTATGTNYFDVQQTVAAGELARALRGPMFGDAAGIAGLSAQSLAAETQVIPGPLDTDFRVTVTDRSGARVTELASRLCAELATQLTQQRIAERAGDADAIHSQLVALETDRARVASGPPTPSSSTRLSSLDTAIAAALRQYSVTLALPDDFVRSTTATGANLVSTSGVRRNLIVAGGAIPLAWFLLILIGESGRRRRPEGVAA